MSQPPSPASAIVLAVPASGAQHQPSTQTIAQVLHPPAPLVEKDSGTIGGAAIGALIALAGVLLTLFFGHVKAKADREHAAAEAHRARLTLTRRDVYLEAVGALGNAQRYLGGMAGREFSDKSYEDGLMPLITAVNKIAVVGEMETVKASRDLITLVMQTFFEAAYEVLPLSILQADIQRFQENWNEAQVEIKRILAAMTNLNESSPPDDPETFNRLMRSFERQQELAAEATTKGQLAHAKLAEGRMRYGSFVVAANSQISFMLDEIAQSVRSELAIGTDFAAFRAQTIQMQEAAEQAMQDLNAKLAAFQASDTQI